MGMAVNRVCIMVRYDNTTNQFICALGNEERMEIVDIDPEDFFQSDIDRHSLLSAIDRSFALRDDDCSPNKKKHLHSVCRMFGEDLYNRLSHSLEETHTSSVRKILLLTDNEEDGYREYDWRIIDIDARNVLREKQKAPYQYGRIVPDQDAVCRWFSAYGASIPFRDFMIQEGILPLTEKELLNNMMSKLRQRYPQGEVFSGSIARLQTCNKDISFWELDRLARKIYQLSAVDYLVRNGILEEPKSAPRDSELHEITQALKQRYSQSKAKSYSQLKKDNPDIKYGTVEKWIKNATGKSPTEYYVSEGIVEAPDVPFENGYQYVVYNHTSKTIERGKSYFPLLSDNLIREIQNAPDFCKDERSAFIIRYSGSDSNVVVPRTIGDAVVRYVGGFISNRDVQTITIPNTVVRLNGQAFNHCKKLEQVILEESSRLIFPAGVFRGCPRLNMPPKGID